MIDRDFFQSVINEITEEYIESELTKTRIKVINVSNILNCINLAVKYKEYLNLDFDEEIWGYSLLSTFQTI